MPGDNITNGRIFTSVVCACLARDLEVLLFAIPRLHRFVRSRNIDVIVPDAEESLFLQQFGDDDRVTVVPESTIASSETRAKIKAVLEEGGMGRQAGWYYQQFLKIQRCAFYDKAEPVLIWDADTVPLRPINFFGTGGGFNFFVGNEYHPPYFATIEKLLNIPKLTPYSFIAQCLPLTGGVARHFIHALGGNSVWVDRVLAALDLGSPHEFSEYETLGQFMLEHYPSTVNLCLFPWLRDGSRVFYRFGSLSKAVEAMEGDFCFAAFERLAMRGPTFLRRRLLSRLVSKGGA